MINSAMYDRIIEKMTKCVEEYEKLKFDNNKFSLSLANGDYVNIRIPRNHIMHLLGLNAEYLKLSNRFRNNLSAYEFLKYFLDNAFSFHRIVSNKEMTYDKMFSDYIDEKLAAFSYNINVRTDDIYCVVKYDREKTYQVEQVAEISDYYIVRKNPKNHAYYILGVVKSDYNDNIYLPSTSRMYTEYSDFNKFMERISVKQEITYPYTMRVDNYDKDYQGSFVLRTDDKIELLDKVTNIAKRYNAVLSVAKDFSFTLNKSNAQYASTNSILNILRLLSESVKSGNVLEQGVVNDLYGNIDLPQNVSNLIDTCNNVVCSMNLNNESAISSYSNLNDENISLKQELQTLKEEVAQYQIQIKNYETECALLQQKNDEYSTKMNIIEEAYQKMKSI